MANLTLIGDIETVAEAASEELGPTYSIRSSTSRDLDEIGALYFRSYQPGEACATESDAVADVAASFAGEYGEFLQEASPVVLSGSNIVAAIMTVKRAPWDHTPACPFIIELFTAPEHRRTGLGTALLAAAANATQSLDRTIALRVERTNSPATALYTKLGFRRWQSPKRT